MRLESGFSLRVGAPLRSRSGESVGSLFRGLLLAVFLATVLLVSCFAVVGFASVRMATASTIQTVTIQGAYHQTEAHKMLGLVNGFRTNAVTSAHDGNEPWYWNDSNSKRVECKNLGKLEWDYSLEKIAMQRAAEIAAVFSHTRPNGTSCFSAKDGSVQSCGENIASGMGWYEDARSVFVGWREDDDSYSGQGHRRNMLGSEFTAFASACFEVDGVYFWVQEFGYSKSDTPSFSGDRPAVDALVHIDPSNEELAYGFNSASKSVLVGENFALPEKLEGVFRPWNGVEVPFSVECPASSWRIVSGSDCVSASSGSWYEAAAAGAVVFETSALGKEVTYTVHVSRLKTSITGLAKSKSAKVGESFALKAVTDSDSKISWSSSNSAVASVDGDGNVTAKAAGTATIKASVAQTFTHESASAACEVTVTNPAAITPSKPSGGQSTGESSASSATSSKSQATNMAAPKGTTLVKVSKAKKAFVAKWKKSSGVKGYQIRWSTKSSMAGAKASTVKSAKVTSKKVSKLKKKTKYYVQVRTYKVVKGKAYWSSWSKAKSVKTK